MSRDSIYQQLTEILREVFGDATLVARPELTVEDVKGWDSFGHLRLVFAVEKQFGVDLSTSQVTSIRSRRRVAETIEGSIESAAGRHGPQ